MKQASCILVATDFSPASACAVNRAAMIASQLDAALHVLHVVPPLNLYPGQNFDVTAHDDAALEGAGKRLDELLQEMTEKYGVRTQAAWRVGLVHAQIAGYARELEADLVVTGARGDHSLVRSFLGSTASRLLRVRSGPHLVVRRPNWPYRHVLAAVDFSADTDEALSWARRLAEGERLDVLHVLDPEFDRRLPSPELEAANADRRSIAARLMENLLYGLPGDIAGHVETGHVQTRIFELAQQWHSDLIVVGRHGHSGLESFLLGSVSMDIVQAAECDVLVAGSE